MLDPEMLLDARAFPAISVACATIPTPLTVAATVSYAGIATLTIIAFTTIFAALAIVAF